MRVYEQSVCIGTNWPIRLLVISTFSMKQLGVFLLPHGCNAKSIAELPSRINLPVPFYRLGQRESHCESTGSYPRTHYNATGQVSNPGPLDLEASILTLRPPCLYTCSRLLLIPVFFFIRRKAFSVTCTHLVQKPLPMQYCMLFMLLLRLYFSLHFSAWGESLFMSVQTCLMVVMYFYYTSRPLPGVVFPFLYGGICYVLTSGLTPMSFLVQFVSLNVVFLVISRVSFAP